MNDAFTSSSDEEARNNFAAGVSDDDEDDDVVASLSLEIVFIARCGDIMLPLPLLKLAASDSFKAEEGGGGGGGR
jgi:hypothetical protein